MGKYYRINQFIQAKEVRVVDEAGKQIGVMPIFNAIQKAREQGVDLVEVSPNAKPPVAKLVDFKKFKYLEAKKEREEKRGIKGGEIKEIQYSPFIAKNDFDLRIKRAREWLEEGNKVKIRVRFSGREMTKKDFGKRLLEQTVQILNDMSSLEGEIKHQGREMFLILSPLKGKKPKNEKTEN